MNANILHGSEPRQPALEPALERAGSRVGTIAQLGESQLRTLPGNQNSTDFFAIQNFVHSQNEHSKAFTASKGSLMKCGDAEFTKFLSEFQ